MKKYLIGMIAIVLAIWFSAFTTIKAKPVKTLTDYYWFNVTTGNGNDNTLNSSQTSYISYGSSVPVGTCSGSPTYNCKVGFSSDQVEEILPGIYRLKTGEQTIVIVGHKRATL